MFKRFLGLTMRAPSGAILAQANEAIEKSIHAEHATMSSRARIDRLVLVNRAAWELERDALGLTDRQLAEKCRELDLKDGRLDGRLSSKAKTCDGCGRVITSGRLTCTYCTAPVNSGSPFDGL